MDAAVVAALIGALALALAGLGGYVAQRSARSKALKVTVQVDAGQPGGPVLDISMLNPASETVLVSSLLLTTITATRIVALDYLAGSHIYDLDLSALAAAGDRSEVKLAQVIDAGAADRIALRMGGADLGESSVGYWRLSGQLRTSHGEVAIPPFEVRLSGS